MRKVFFVMAMIYGGILAFFGFFLLIEGFKVSNFEEVLNLILVILFLIISYIPSYMIIRLLGTEKHVEDEIDRLNNLLENIRKF